MNPRKQQDKILKCLQKAEDCTSRKKAQKILRKHQSAVDKLDSVSSLDTDYYEDNR